jgi:hypothetical protein
MITTWTKVNTKLDLVLYDAPRYNAAGELVTPLFSEPLRIECWNWAQRVLVHHTPRACSMTLVIETGEREAVLPDDFFAMQGIYDADNERWWSPVAWQPGDIRYADDKLETYWAFGDRLYLENTIEYSATNLTMYYWAYFPDVEYTLDDDGNVENLTQEILYTPQWAELALVHLCTATCMMPGEVFAADINEYKIRVDSGTPLHNPRKESAYFHLDMWHRLIDMFPPARRGEVR